MMTLTGLRNLAVLTVTSPADAARALVAMQFPREVLWTALFLAVILNTLLYSLSNMLAPAPSPFPALFGIPAVYLVIIGTGLVLSIYSIHWIGRMMGGQGSLDDVMTLIVWLQYMRIAVQVATLILAVTVPVLAALLVLAASLMGLWIMLNFVDQGLRLGSLGRAAVVLIGSVVAIAVLVSVLLTLVGGTLLGPAAYV
ncbi:YIP1 family protein [Seohaeicola saemankumensis]|nr:YIP1 family protein [Seohaeicola saemankumensis]MCA0873753.1 YIP1 family protein [Seohaeicola saemankumensis]